MLLREQLRFIEVDLKLNNILVSVDSPCDSWNQTRSGYLKHVPLIHLISLLNNFGFINWYVLAIQILIDHEKVFARFHIHAVNLHDTSLIWSFVLHFFCWDFNDSPFLVTVFLWMDHKLVLNRSVSCCDHLMKGKLILPIHIMLGIIVYISWIVTVKHNSFEFLTLFKKVSHLNRSNKHWIEIVSYNFSLT